MSVTEIRAAHFILDASNALIEYLQSIGASDAPWGDWRVVPGHPAESTGQDEKQLLIWVEYKRIQDERHDQGYMIAEGIKGYFAQLFFEIGARSGSKSGWLNELLEAESALRYKLTRPFGVSSTLSALGLRDFEFGSEDERSPTQERPHYERAWSLTCWTPVAEEA